MKKIKKELLEKEFVVKTPTEAKMNEIITVLGDDEFPFFDFDEFKEKTCIRFKEFGNVFYGNEDYYERTGLPLYNYDEIWDTNPTVKLQDFEVGKVYTVKGIYHFLVGFDGIYFRKDVSTVENNAWELMPMRNNMFDWEFTEVEAKPFKERVKYEDSYFFICDAGEVLNSIYLEDKVDLYRKKIDNFFETREEAEKHKVKIVKKED